MSLASAAVKNPKLQKAMANAVNDAAYDKVKNEMPEENDEVTKKVVIDGSVLDVTDEELGQLKKWSRNLRIAMIVISCLMIALAWYNFLSTSSVDISNTFIALYIFLFAILICCFECAFKQAAFIIVQNFGFMYNPIGRFLFLFIVGFLCFELSTFGKVLFAFLIVYGCVYAYVSFKHPKYGKYLRTLHYFNRAKAKSSTHTKDGFDKLEDMEEP